MYSRRRAGSCWAGPLLIPARQLFVLINPNEEEEALLRERMNLEKREAKAAKKSSKKDKLLEVGKAEAKGDKEEVKRPAEPAAAAPAPAETAATAEASGGPTAEHATEVRVVGQGSSDRLRQETKKRKRNLVTEATAKKKQVARSLTGAFRPGSFIAG
jgi:hypothetical protein